MTMAGQGESRELRCLLHEDVVPRAAGAVRGAVLQSYVRCFVAAEPLAVKLHASSITVVQSFDVQGSALHNV